LSIEDLLNIAKKYIKNCYAPYSKIRVVSVLETIDGEIFVGVNVENASYGLTICAERVAIFKAVSEGKKKFKRILIYSPDVLPYPCGACRQVMAEFFDGKEKVIVANDKEIREHNFDELLPFSFKI